MSSGYIRAEELLEGLKRSGVMGQELGVVVVASGALGPVLVFWRCGCVR